MRKEIYILLLICSSLFAQFSVEEFSFGTSYPQAPTPLFLPYHGSLLCEISNPPNEMPFLRRRFSGSEYRLYEGRFSDSAFALYQNLQKFLRPKSISRDQFARLKLFDSQRINSVGDVKDCYYHGDTVYVVGFNRLFYTNNGKWEQLVSLEQFKLKKSGDLALRSSPSGAIIVINGDTTGVNTPNYITAIPEGVCKIRIIHPDCIPFDTTINVIGGTIHTLSRVLYSRYGSAVFTGSPIGAKVRLDGREIGTIPCRIENLLPAEYLFSIEESFHQKKVVSKTIVAGTVCTTAVTLAKAFGVISLPEMPDNRWWFINGEPVSSGMLRFNRGTHRIFWDGGDRYCSIDTVITVVQSDTVALHVQAQVRRGGIKVLPLPMSCSLFVDGTYRGEAPIVVDGLTPGEHVIELVSAGFDHFRQTITVKGESVEEFRCLLKKSSDCAVAMTSKKMDAKAAELTFFSTKGQARVYQGDSLVAVTGKGSVKIPAGKYQFRFENAQESVMKMITVAIGERKAVLVNFAEN